MFAIPVRCCFPPQPLFVRLDTPTHFQFRVRNCPWEYDNYTFDLDESNQEIILRTKNKKYYKKFNIPDLKIGGDAGKLSLKFLNWKHANNTLIISYVKPPFMLELDKKNRQWVRSMGNGSTSAAGTAAPAAGQQQSTAQRLLADSQTNTAASPQSSSGGGAGEFAGLAGLKGLSAAGGKDGDCKQQ
jgi:hypothetical protein